ncbi:hypothetical protein PPERSA_11257 [Pseudocohnilembus persalinus]|uniref:Uncharacterized protein n=1 Tax=Pseudocohnilembus persalinus TaxID=266149 RepID=A0A0V0QZJ1_PSEPJ|nr:hypothetical protein PPERSA_11257 [Pseudocohnilembus persalinus]|eukprot:KRX07708.1 hypothetical protein PPERSA_11257 [Pseudocohnilembus persalinus]
MARKFGCDTTGKIEIKEMINECACSNEELCLWTKNRQPVYGCPCPEFPRETDYTCVDMAQILGCGNEEIVCEGKIGKCKCLDGSQCLWNDKTPLHGCPCAEGRLPVDADFEPKPKIPKKNKKNKKRKSKRENDDDL